MRRVLPSNSARIPAIETASAPPPTSRPPSCARKLGSSPSSGGSSNAPKTMSTPNPPSAIPTRATTSLPPLGPPKANSPSPATVGQTDGVSQVIEAPVEVQEPTTDDVPVDERPWVVIVWNDPINLMSYVTLVLQQLFGYSRAKATKLMLQVHNEGKAAVSTGTREKAELDVSRLHAHGLWATMQQD